MRKKKFVYPKPASHFWLFVQNFISTHGHHILNPASPPLTPPQGFVGPDFLRSGGGGGVNTSPIFFLRCGLFFLEVVFFLA